MPPRGPSLRGPSVRPGPMPTKSSVAPMKHANTQKTQTPKKTQKLKPRGKPVPKPEPKPEPKPLTQKTKPRVPKVPSKNVTQKRKPNPVPRRRVNPRNQNRRNQNPRNQYQNVINGRVPLRSSEREPSLQRPNKSFFGTVDTILGRLERQRPRSPQVNPLIEYSPHSPLGLAPYRPPSPYSPHSPQGLPPGFRPPSPPGLPPGFRPRSPSGLPPFRPRSPSGSPIPGMPPLRPFLGTSIPFRPPSPPGLPPAFRPRSPSGSPNPGMPNPLHSANRSKSKTRARMSMPIGSRLG